MSNFYFSINSSLGFDETCVQLRKTVEAAKWAILGGYDFSETLAGKGFPQNEKIKTFDICNARHANEMLTGGIEIAICMPCTIVVFTDSGTVKIATINPNSVVPALFDQQYSAQSATLEAVDAELLAILTASCS